MTKQELDSLKIGDVIIEILHEPRYSVEMGVLKDILCGHGINDKLRVYTFRWVPLIKFDGLYETYTGSVRVCDLLVDEIHSIKNNK